MPTIRGRPLAVLACLWTLALRGAAPARAADELPHPTSADPAAVATAQPTAADPAPATTAQPPPATPMIELPGGTFRAGEPTGPLRDIVTYHRIRPFLLDATEVTVAAYRECVGAGACTPAATTVRWDALTEDERAQWSARCNGDREDRLAHPVNCVDWSQAEAYCAWAGKRLPSEEEWEWAARNGRRGTSWPWGEDAPTTQACWSGGPGGARSSTCPVGAHPAGDSAAGAKDLAGGVWEWTTTATVVFPDSRGRGGTPVRVARGGGWVDAAPYKLSTFFRSLERPTRRSPDLGFRCARRR